MANFKFYGTLLTANGAAYYQNLPQEPPVVDPSPGMTDALLAKSMNEMSMIEKERALEEIHGVASIGEEDPDTISRCLDDLEIEISKIDNKGAYDEARSMSPEYVTNRKFVLQFLRADSFNVHDAAQRIVSYFELKLDLFGPSKLVKDITQSDLDDGDRAYLESGYGQVMRERDRSGRAILCVIPSCVSNWAPSSVGKNKLRSTFYVLSKAAEDEQTQKMGVVGILCGFGKHKKESDRSIVWKNLQISQAIPVRWTALHFCFEDEGLHWLYAMAALVLESRTRIRCRCHTGGQVECLYKLLTFGIPTEAFPMSLTGEIRQRPHLEFLRRQRELEEQASDSSMSTAMDIDSITIVPESQDVLLGRGKGFRYHPGNVRFHKIIEAHEQRYESANRLGKQLLSETILKLVKESGSRFLKQDVSGWFVVGDSIARERVAHAFRNRRLTSKASASSSSSKMSTSKNNFNSSSILSTPQSHLMMKGHRDSTADTTCISFDISTPWNAIAS